MLQDLLDLLETTDHRLTQDQICEKLGIKAESLLAMLQILASKRRILTQPIAGEGTCGEVCQDCPALLKCTATTFSVSSARDSHTS